MATIEQVEKLREKANVTYDEAKLALDVTDGDILEAMIYLERNGKVEPPKNGGYYNSESQKEPEKENANITSSHYYQNGETFAQLARKFFGWIRKMVGKGNVNIFEVWRNNQVMTSVPVTVLVLLLIFAFWIVVPLIVVGLFFGCRYIFRGPDLEKTGVNRMMDTAADAAENLKKEIKDGQNDK